ncbi:DUF7147 family protein [Bhargavaea ginsengi]|uniref:DUF7147 family protein n=1 Tax=Bhargavaea ginsengi TaxID=426757 RepID=UPI00203B1C2F|nr:methylthioribose kinase [Bhargavaea ginsengi]MCM3087317.1 methylthioribose kinase [Bhargavaea ginsengi]
MNTQRFIELGEGLGDIFELCELIRTNTGRLHRAFIFTTGDGGVLSPAAAFDPAGEGNYMPIYICREGIRGSGGESARITRFREAAAAAGATPVTVEVRRSTDFSDRDQYYRHITGILRLNHLIPPLG